MVVARLALLKVKGLDMVDVLLASKKSPDMVVVHLTLLKEKIPDMVDVLLSFLSNITRVLINIL